MPGLPGVIVEAERLKASGEALVDAEATRDAVRAALPKATWAHFACHAISNFMAPATGGLHLHDGVFAAAEIGELRLGEANCAVTGVDSPDTDTRYLAVLRRQLTGAVELLGASGARSG